MSEKLQYIAGVLDSGCRIAIERHETTYRPVIELQRKDIQVLRIVQEEFGGVISRQRLRIKGEKAYILARRMFSLMLTRHREMRILLDLSTVKGRGKAEMRESIKKLIHKPIQTCSLEHHQEPDGRD